MVYSGLEFGQYFEINRKEIHINNNWIPFDLHTMCFRRFKLLDVHDGTDAGGPNDAVHHSNAVHIPQHNRSEYGTTQSGVTLRTHAHGGDEFVRMAVRFG